MSGFAFCTACGERIPADSKFCTSCGAKQWAEPNYDEDYEEEFYEEEEPAPVYNAPPTPVRSQPRSITPSLPARQYTPPSNNYASTNSYSNNYSTPSVPTPARNSPPKTSSTPSWANNSSPPATSSFNSSPDDRFPTSSGPTRARGGITKRRILEEAKKGFFGSHYTSPEEQSTTRANTPSSSSGGGGFRSKKFGLGKLKEKSQKAITSTRGAAASKKDVISQRNVRGLFQRDQSAPATSSSNTTISNSAPPVKSTPAPVSTPAPKPKPAPVSTPSYSKPPAPKPKPSVWEAYTTEEGDTYYYNWETKESTWVKPAGFGTSPAPPASTPSSGGYGSSASAAGTPSESSGTITGKMSDKEYARKARREAIKERRRFGPKIQSLYQHKTVSSKCCSFVLQDTRKQGKKGKVTVYEIAVSWKGVNWNVYRRYQQFWDWNRKVKHRTKITLPAQLPSKKLFGKNNADVVEARKIALGHYLEGVTNHQLKFLNDPYNEQLLIRFMGPLQMGDSKPDQPLPFKIQLT